MSERASELNTNKATKNFAILLLFLACFGCCCLTWLYCWFLLLPLLLLLLLSPSLLVSWHLAAHTHTYIHTTVSGKCAFDIAMPVARLMASQHSCHFLYQTNNNDKHMQAQNGRQDNKNGIMKVLQAEMLAVRQSDTVSSACDFATSSTLFWGSESYKWCLMGLLTGLFEWLFGWLRVRVWVWFCSVWSWLVMGHALWLFRALFHSTTAWCMHVLEQPNKKSIKITIWTARQLSAYA